MVMYLTEFEQASLVKIIFQKDAIQVQQGNLAVLVIALKRVTKVQWKNIKVTVVTIVIIVLGHAKLLNQMQNFKLLP